MNYNQIKVRRRTVGTNGHAHCRRCARHKIESQTGERQSQASSIPSHQKPKTGKQSKVQTRNSRVLLLRRTNVHEIVKNLKETFKNK